MLGNLTVSSVLPGSVVGAEPDRAVGDDLVHDLAGALVGDLGDVAQRAHVVHVGSNWPSATLGERRVLAVGGEHPRVVGPAGAAEADAVDGAARRAGTSLPWSTWRTWRSSAAWVESARFCLPQSMPSCSRRSPGSESLVQSPSSSRAAILLLQRRGRVASRPCRARRGRRPGPCRSRRRRPTASRVLRPGRGPRSAAARPCPCRTGRRRRGWASPAAVQTVVALVAAVAVAGLTAGRGAGRSRRARRSRAARSSGAAACPARGRRSRPPSKAGGVGQVLARVGLGVVEAPRVRAHQLRVGVDLHRDGARGDGRVGQLEAEHAARPPSGAKSVRLTFRPPVSGRSMLGVAPAAGELRRLADPLVVDRRTRRRRRASAAASRCRPSLR